MADFILPQEIPFIPGYYLKKSINSGNFDTSDAKYIGTTWDPNVDKVDSEYNYLYNVISLARYTLVSQYKVPEDGYCYFVSSSINHITYYKSTGTTTQQRTKPIPAGVVGVLVNDNGLKVERLTSYFKYHGIERPASSPVSDSEVVTFTNIKSSPWTINGQDNTGAPATVTNCAFYPSRFNGHLSKHNWTSSEAQAFNNLLTSSGFRYLHQIKYSSDIDSANILADNQVKTTILNSDEPAGLRYSSIRRLLSSSLIGTAKMVGNKYVIAGQWDSISGFIHDNYINLGIADNWKHVKSLEFIWSYIMTVYLNSSDPSTAISTSYSDAAGWSTTWRTLYMVGNSHGTVIQANTECDDNKVSNPGSGVLPAISESNLPCACMDLIFDAQIGTLTTRGLVRLSVGGRKWDISDTPYRYFEHGKSNSNIGLELSSKSILYKATVEYCDFILQYPDNDNIVTERVTPNISGYGDHLALAPQIDSSNLGSDWISLIDDPTEIQQPENLSDSLAEVLYR